jgi:predicted CoA-binding protein
MSQPESVVILGASRSRNKFGNIAVRAFAAEGHDVYPVNPYADEIEGIKTYHSLAELPVQDVDRVSVYLHPELGITLLEEIQGLNPAEVWFNPGSESPELVAKAEELGLPVIQACSIVGVGRSPSEFGN